MNNFNFYKAATKAEALTLLTLHPHSKFLGGGTNLLDLMRENIEQPQSLIDITGVPFDSITEGEGGGVTIGAETRNSAVALDKLVRERFPVLSQAVVNGASGQIRNMATVGGNLMQRTRCYYFYDEAARCNKRKPGTGCDAIEGFNRIHAILGASPSCIATHPSDMCVALAALDAVVRVEGNNGMRTIPLTDFHKLPGDRPDVETELGADELITQIEIPALGAAKNSLYRKVRDRASYAFALVSVAAVLETEGGNVKTLRLALGGVAAKPWRARAAESAAMGQPATAETFERAAQAELVNARGYAHNGFKIELAKRTMVSVLNELVKREGAK